MPLRTGLYLRVGALVLAGIVLGIGFLLFIASHRFGGDNVVYETYIRESVQGLEVGAAVRYRGVSLGRVTNIGLVASEYRRPEGTPFEGVFQLVLVRFAVDVAKVSGVPDAAEAVRQGLRVRLASQGLTGVSYLELDYVSPDRFPPAQLPWTPQNTYIPAVPSTVAQVQSAAESLLAQLEAADLAGIVTNLSGLVSDLRRETSPDGRVSQALQESVLLLRGLRGAVEGSDLPAAVAELRGVAADARRLIGGPEAQAAVGNAAAAAAELRGVIARLPRSLNSLEASLRNTRGATSDVQADLAPILRDLRSAVSNLRDTTELLRRYPSQAIFGAPPPAERSR